MAVPTSARQTVELMIRNEWDKRQWWSDLSDLIHIAKTYELNELVDELEEHQIKIPA